MPDHGTMISEIIEVASDACSEWECEFMESIQGRSRALTDKQAAVLERIYAKVCRGPTDGKAMQVRMRRNG